MSREAQESSAKANYAWMKRQQEAFLGRSKLPGKAYWLEKKNKSGKGGNKGQVQEFSGCSWVYDGVIHLC